VRSRSACLSVIACNHLPVTDGKGAWRDNVFVERLWRTIKYEEVFLRAYASVSEARAGIGRYLRRLFSRTSSVHRLRLQQPPPAFVA